MLTRLLVLIGGLLLLASCDFENTTGPDGDNGTTPDDTTRFTASSSRIPTSVQPNTAKDIDGTDLGGDGDIDLVLATEYAANRLLINDGSGNFTGQTPRSISTKSLDSEHLVAADFNGDTNVDLFFANQENQTNEFYLSQGSGSYVDVSSQLPFTGISLSAAATDVNNDGSTDLFVGNDGQNFLMLNTGNAFFTPVPERISSHQGISYSVAPGDLNADGRMDLVVANNIDNQILINTGGGFFERQTSARLPLIEELEETRDLELADLNGDGALDLFFANVGFQTAADAQNRLLINNGNGVFGDSTATHLPQYQANTLAADITDLNGDDAPDIITGDYDGGIRILINDGSGQFTDNSDSWIPAQATPQVQDLVAADFNGDGLPDLYVCSVEGDDMLLMQQNTD